MPLIVFPLPRLSVQSGYSDKAETGPRLAMRFRT
jgi:hypothetical protein